MLLVVITHRLITNGLEVSKDIGIADIYIYKHITYSIYIHV